VRDHGLKVEGHVRPEHVEDIVEEALCFGRGRVRSLGNDSRERFSHSANDELPVEYHMEREERGKGQGRDFCHGREGQSEFRRVLHDV
jgi:hypothetical protein